MGDGDLPHLGDDRHSNDLPGLHRRRGKFRPFTEEQQDIALSRGDRPGPVPYRFIYDGGTIFARPAADVIITTLRQNPDPPRLASHRS